MALLLSFGEFTFDPAAGALVRGVERVPLEPQPARLLAHLVEHAGELVTREQLAGHLWGRHTHVDFAEGLNYCVRQARVALGDDARQPVYIETLPRRGYRFLLPVLPVLSVERVTRAAPASPRGSRRWRWSAVALVACVGILAVAERRPNRHHELALQLVDTVHDAIWGE